MKKEILIIALMLFSVFGFSQEINTLFSKDASKTTTWGGYGAPLINASQLNKNWGIGIGGKGGFIINHKFAFGGIGYGIISNNSFMGNNLADNTNASLKLRHGAGGLFLEYYFKLEKSIHLSIPVNFMAGRISVYDAVSKKNIESSGVFILEPGVSLEFNIAKYFIPAINVSYRQVFGSSLKNIDNKDISGLSIGMVLKFGFF